MEGSTGYVYRNVHHALFGVGIARYYAPFVVATYTRKLKTRERADLLPEHNQNIPLVPQILANDPDAFLFTVRSMADLGYTEVNLNLGCPVGTVVSKHKGAGMLRFPEELNRFLEAVFDGADRQQLPVQISIKTRIGFDRPEEADTLFPIFEAYPIHELIIHARTRKEQYSGQPEIAAFLEIARRSHLPLCYNGNIATASDWRTLQQLLTQLPSGDSSSSPRGSSINCMIGRGLLGNPGLVRQIRTGQTTSRPELQQFHDRLYEGYREQYASFHGQSSGITVVLNCMKEVWTHLGDSFLDQGHYLRNIHKARNRYEYEAAVRMLFANCPVREPSAAFHPLPEKPL